MLPFASLDLPTLVNTAVRIVMLLMGIALSLNCIDLLKSFYAGPHFRQRASNRRLTSMRAARFGSTALPSEKKRVRDSRPIYPAGSRIRDVAASLVRAISRTNALPLIAYLLAIALAESIATWIGVGAGLLCEMGIILFLLGHYIIGESISYRPILPILALAPFLRILSFTVPISLVPEIYWYALVGLPFLVAVALTARRLNLTGVQLGLGVSFWPAQLLIILSALPLSLVAYFLVRPKPIVTDLSWPNVVIEVVILSIFVGFAEEVFFRGMLLTVATELLGRFGLVYSSVVFAVMQVGSLSWSYVLFMGLVGLFFGWCVQRTGSIWSAVLAHGIFSAYAILIWPLLWR